MIPSTLLQNKKILVGITGSISAYKSIEMIRMMTKAGAEVRVLMTEGAKRFITPLTLESLTGNQILDEHTENWHSDHNHIGIGKWADAFIIAPVTANTINKLACGIADNLLTQTVLAYDKEKIIAPAANTVMFDNPITQASLEKLTKLGFTIIAPQTKELACRTEGNGALAEPTDIFYAVCRCLLNDTYWKDRHVVVSGGGTVEKIDDVRYISNFSSGKMASALVLALYFKGAAVSFISSAYPVALPSNIDSIKVQSAHEMHEALTKSLAAATDKCVTTPYLFMAAAVADYYPQDSSKGKLKKAALGDAWSIAMQSNIDILQTLDKKGIKAIGFKAEMDAQNAHKYASQMLIKKKLDGVCLNILNDKNSFGSDRNTITLISHQEPVTFENQDKLSLSLNLLQALAQG